MRLIALRTFPRPGGKHVKRGEIFHASIGHARQLVAINFATHVVVRPDLVASPVYEVKEQIPEPAAAEEIFEADGSDESPARKRRVKRQYKRKDLNPAGLRTDDDQD